MRPASLESELLRTLAEMPFLDRLELAAVTGWSRGAVYRGVGRLERDGCAASLPHATGVVSLTRRCHLTAEGLRRLAGMEGSTVDELLRLRPVSDRWRRILLERLDGVAVIYRLAAAVSNLAHSVRFRWYRAAPLDAAMTLSGERTVGVLRQGRTADRTGFAKRIWRLGQGPLPGLVLILIPDEVRLRHARRLLARTPVNALLALEADAVSAGPGHRVWRPPAGNAALDLRYALQRLRPGGELPVEEPLAQATMPGDEVDAPAILLKPAEKRALDLLSDWPWLSRGELAALLDVSEPRVSQLAVSLEGHGLATRPGGAGGRLALSDTGLALLARRDRASVSAARKRFSVNPIDAARPMHWRNVSGGRSRQLLRNLEHTAAVHRFIADLAAQARALGWDTAQLDPPHRASRHFPHQGRRRSIHPDASGLLRQNRQSWAFLLEWERRAVRPATMYQRLAPYLRYYSTLRPTDDHGVRPDALVVFDDDIAAGHFLRLAERELNRAGVNVPLRVSHRRVINALGPLGPVWHAPGRDEPAQLLPASGATQLPGRRDQGAGKSAGPRSLPSRNASAVSSQHINQPEGPRGRGGRAVVRLDAAALWERLALLGRSQNWLAGEIGVSHAYVSMLVNGGRSPSEGIQRRMLKALGLSQIHELFRPEVTDE